MDNSNVEQQATIPQQVELAKRTYMVVRTNLRAGAPKGNTRPVFDGGHN